MRLIIAALLLSGCATPMTCVDYRESGKDIEVCYKSVCRDMKTGQFVSCYVSAIDGLDGKGLK